MTDPRAAEPDEPYEATELEDDQDETDAVPTPQDHVPDVSEHPIEDDPTVPQQEAPTEENE